MNPHQSAPTLASGSPQNRLAHPRSLPDMLLYRINRLRAVGGAIVLRFCEGQFGITRREWVVIALLVNQDGATSSELAARAELTKSAISKALGSLGQKGLVTRSAQPGDHRFARLSLSDAGKALYGEILPLVEEVNRDLMSCLSPQQVSELDTTIAQLETQASFMAERMGTLPKADRRRGGTQRHAGANTGAVRAPFA
jgi:DNA-binding MarR family transcriptional regulator